MKLRTLMMACIVIGLFFCTTSLVHAQPSLFPIDSWHSSISFSVKFGALFDVKGSMRQFEGVILFDDKDLTKMSATVIVETESIDTGLSVRDNHLKSDEFFDVESYPRIVFKSTEIIRGNDGHTMIGDLTIRGTIRKVEIPFILVHGEEKDPWGNNRITLRGNLKVNRQDYGVDKEGVTDNAVGDEVIIDLLISARIFNTESIALFLRPFGKTIWEKIETDGIQAGIDQYYVIKEANDIDIPKVTSLDFVGARLIQYQRFEEAVKIFELNTKAFPEIGGTFSRLAEAHFMNGDEKLALQIARLALEKDEFDPIAIELVKLLSR